MKFTAIRNATRVFFILLLGIWCVRDVSAQAPAGTFNGTGTETATGTIKGTIMDVSGAVVTGADLKATNEATGQALTTSSTATGEFVFRNLPAGSYTIEVSSRGFQTFRSAKIAVPAGGAHGSSFSALHRS